MGLGVSQFGQRDIPGGAIISLQNGLTEVTPGVGELGGTLLHNTSLNGNNFQFALQLISSGLFRIFGRDSVGSNFPFWADVNTTTQVYGHLTGQTLGRTYRMTKNVSSFLDFGFDPNNLMYMTKVHTGSIVPLNTVACMRVDSLGRFAFGLNTTTPLLLPTAYIHLAQGTAVAGTSPLKFSPAINNLAIPEAGAVEYNGTDFFVTTSTLLRFPIQLKIYGSMFATNVTQPIVIPAINTFVEIPGSITGGPSSGFTFQNLKEVKCDVAGTYKVNYSVSIDPNSLVFEEVTIAIMINGVAQTFGQAKETARINGSTNISSETIITLAVNDLVSIAVANNTSTNSLDMKFLSFTIGQP